MVKRKKKNKINRKKESLMSKLFVDEEDYMDEDENTTHDDTQPIEAIKNTSNLENTSSEEINKNNTSEKESTLGLDVLDISDNSYNKFKNLDETMEFDGFDSSLYKQNRKFNGVTIGLIVTIILLVIAIGIALVFYKGTTDHQVEMINLVGKTQNEASKWCDDNKLDNTQCIFETEYSESVEEDQIISQSIASGEKLSAKSAVKFVVSEGKDPDLEIDIPDFTNMSSQEILDFFEENGFTNVTIEYEVDPKKEDDSFVSSNIQNNKAKRSDAIVILISIQQANDDMEIEVPDFKEYTKANIQAWANKYRISLVIAEEYSDTVAKDKFISQSIKAGEKIKVSTKLTVTFSKGKKIAMEDFTKMSQKEVQSWCDTNGVKCSFTDTIYSSVEKGKIAAQSVKKGTMVSSIKSIKFTLSLGDTVEIGNYKDQDYKKFEERIATINKLGANITIKKETEVTNDKNKDNILVSNTESAKMNTEINAKVYVYQAAQVDVPKCSGDEESYKKALTDLNLKPQRQGQQYSSSTSGTVIGCSVSNGKVNEGTTITYYISKGDYSPNANDFNGKTDADARNIVNTAINQGASGWSYTSSQEYNDSIASGTTFGCEISGKTVKCKVSKGKQPVVGNYVGKIWGGTTEWVVDGITLVSDGAAYHDSIPVNGIISQDIAAGTKADENTRVLVILSKGPQPPELTVGSILGCEVANGQCKIGAFTINVTEVESDQAVKTIISQSCDSTKKSCDVTISKGLTTYTTTVNIGWFSNAQDSLESAKSTYNVANAQVSFETVVNSLPKFSLQSIQFGNNNPFTKDNCEAAGGIITNGGIGCQFTYTSSTKVKIIINKNE